MEEILFDEEKDDFEHPIYIKILLSIFSVFLMISSYIVIRRLLIFVRRPNRRPLDFIVDFQNSVGIVLVFISMVFFNIIVWAEVPKTYVSEVGCYTGTFLFYFLAPYCNSHSFFISLFRFICILYPGKLSSRGISPEVNLNTYLFQLPHLSVHLSQLLFLHYNSCIRITRPHCTVYTVVEKAAQAIWCRAV